MFLQEKIPLNYVQCLCLGLIWNSIYLDQDALGKKEQPTYTPNTMLDVWIYSLENIKQSRSTSILVNTANPILLTSEGEISVQKEICLVILALVQKAYLTHLSLPLQSNSINVSVGWSLYWRLLHQGMKTQLKAWTRLWEKFQWDEAMQTGGPAKQVEVLLHLIFKTAVIITTSN